MLGGFSLEKSFKEVLKKWENKNIEEMSDEDIEDINKIARKLDIKDNLFLVSSSGKMKKSFFNR